MKANTSHYSSWLTVKVHRSKSSRSYLQVFKGQGRHVKDHPQFSGEFRWRAVHRWRNPWSLQSRNRHDWTCLKPVEVKKKEWVSPIEQFCSNMTTQEMTYRGKVSAPPKPLSWYGPTSYCKDAKQGSDSSNFLSLRYDPEPELILVQPALNTMLCQLCCLTNCAIRPTVLSGQLFSKGAGQNYIFQGNLKQTIGQFLIQMQHCSTLNHLAWCLSETTA